MSRSNIVGGKNRLTKACLISSQVVITPGLSSLNQILASPARDDGKSFNLMASALVLPYQNFLHISSNLAMCLCGSARERPSNCQSLIMERWYPLTVKLSPRSTAKIAASGVGVIARLFPHMGWTSAIRKGRGFCTERQRAAPGGREIVKRLCWDGRGLRLAAPRVL
ncbi:hypothetical protein Tco_1483930 [Tanacetum coccineum]